MASNVDFNTREQNVIKCEDKWRPLKKRRKGLSQLVNVPTILFHNHVVQ